MCIQPTEGIPIAGASVEASRSVKAVRVKDRHIRSWGGGCVNAGERWEAIPIGLRQQEVKPSRGEIPDRQEGVPGSSVGY